MGVGVGTAVGVGVGNAVAVGTGVGVGGINTVKDVVAKVPLAELAYTVVIPGPRYGTSTSFSKFPLWSTYIQLELIRLTPPIVISVMHSYLVKSRPVTEMIDPGYPEYVFNVSLADGTGVTVGVVVGTEVFVGTGVGVDGIAVGVGVGIAVAVGTGIGVDVGHGV